MTVRSWPPMLGIGTELRRIELPADARGAVALCPIEDLPERSRVIITAGPRRIAVFNLDGELRALQNMCPHQRGPLCEGKVTGTLDADADSDWKPVWAYDDHVVTCPWHGLEFHIDTGRCLAYPRVRVKTYDVSVIDGVVTLEL